MSTPAHRRSAADEHGDRVSLRRLVDALTAAGVWHRQRADHVDFRCPLPDHPDRNASGSADWRVAAGDRPGAVRLVCHGCGPTRTGEIVTTLGLSWSDLFDDAPARPAPSSPRARPATGSTPTHARTTSPRTTSPCAPRSTGAAPAPLPGKAAAPARRGNLVATHRYVDAAGELVGECRRYHASDPDGGRRRKTFAWRRPDPTAPRGWVTGMPSPCPLYRLPDLLAADLTDAPAPAPVVWLVEGETSADAAAAAGALAVSAPNGAHAGWLPEYGEALRGAAVVVVADRDTPGMTRARTVAAALADLAVSVHVVRTPLDVPGADVVDHLAAGLPLTLAAFEPVELTAAAPAVDPGPTDPGPTDPDAPAGELVPFPRPAGLDDDEDQADDPDDGLTAVNPGGGGGGGGPAQARQMVRDVFEQVDQDGGAVVEVRRVPGAGSDAREIMIELLDARVRIVRRIAVDAGDGTPVGVRFVDLVAERAGETVELRRVPIEDFRKAAYLDLLPWPTTWKDTAAGRSKLANAITKTSGPVPVTRAFGSLGWRESADGWLYVHGAGGIGPSGPVPGIEVDVSSRLAAFSMPTPPAGPVELGAALRGVLAVLDAFPGRIAAPVMGAPLRAILGETRASVFLIGHTGSRKSGVAALAQQVHMPSARHNRLPVGAGEAATTATSMEELLWQCGDALLVADDLAPDRGAERSAVRANELLRAVGNGVSKARGARTGGLRPDRPPRALLMLTGEDGASRPSAESRTVYVPLAPGDVPLDVIRDLSARDLVAGRNATGAALVQYVAGRMPVAEWVETTRDRLSGELLTATGHGDDADGLASRRADAVAELATGWRALLDAATAGRALDEDAAAAVWARVWAGLVECLAGQTEVTDRRGLAERAADLLRSCLRSGRAHLEAEVGGAPSTDRVRACGWRKEEGQYGDLRPGGDAVGWATDDRTHVWLDPGAVFAVLERQARAESDPLAVTPRALTAALLAAELLSIDRVPGRARPVPQVRRRAAGTRQRVWELPWSWLWPDDDPDDTRHSDPAPTDNPPPHPADPAAAGNPVANAPSSAPAPATDIAPLAGPAPARTPLATPLPAGIDPAPPATEPAMDPQPPAELHAASVAPNASPIPGAGRSGPLSGPPTASDAAPRYVAPGVVVDVDTARLIGGPALTVPADLDSLPALVAWADTLGLGVTHGRSRDDAGQVWVMPALARRLGLHRRPDAGTTRATASHPAVCALTAAGWEVGHRGLQPWTHLWQRGRAGLHVVIVPWLAEDVLCPPKAPPSVTALADRLDVYQSLVTSPTGEAQPWLYSAGTTGTTLLRLCRATAVTGGLRVDQQPPPAEDGDGRRWEPEWSWQRGPTPVERRRRFLVSWDVTAQYLAAAGSVLLGLDEPRHVRDVAPLADGLGSLTAPARAPKLPPGYWRVPRSARTGAALLLPDLLDPTGEERAADVWITTPTLVAARQHGADLRPVEAWLWDQHTTWLQSWAHSLRDARYAADAAVAAYPADDDLRAVALAVKLTYAAGIGMLGSRRLREGGEHYRPDARHQLIGLAKANLFRKCARAAAAGWAPLGIWRDAVVFASDSDDPEQTPPPGFALGTKLGGVKWNGAALMDDVAAALAESAAPNESTFGLLRKG